jgi:hypothetical protein
MNQNLFDKIFFTLFDHSLVLHCLKIYFIQSFISFTLLKKLNSFIINIYNIKENDSINEIIAITANNK